MLRRIGAHVAHGPVYVGPLFSPCPVVITLHDLSFLRHPGLLRSGSRAYLTLFTRLSARRARRAIAVSSHTAREAAQLLGLDRRRIDVIYHGVAEMFRPMPPEEVEGFRQRQRMPDRYVLYLGTLEPRKNLARLVEAFASGAPPGWVLVLAGGKGWGYQALAQEIQSRGVVDRVLVAGYVADEDLPLLYNAATVFAYPSLYEGFGMPVLEAMACGVPVLTSNTSSLPEVAGDAALLVDPESVDEMAAGMHRLLSDASLRLQLRGRGLDRASGFRWGTTARQTAHTYQLAASGVSA
jgi:glycosyltransferase involved in cell wall biosynthesis